MSVSQITIPLIPAAASAVPQDMLDFEVLKAFENIKAEDGSDILVDLIDLYLLGTSRRIKEMRKAAVDCDWAFLKRTAHTLKGSSGTLGLHQIAKTCRDVETTSLSFAREAEALIDLLELQFLEATSLLIAERDRRRALPR